MTINITNAQLEAIKRMADALSSMIGSCDEKSSFDKDITHDIKMLDKMLENNKLKPRDFK